MDNFVVTPGICIFHYLKLLFVFNAKLYQTLLNTSFKKKDLLEYDIKNVEKKSFVKIMATTGSFINVLEYFLKVCF